LLLVNSSKSFGVGGEASLDIPLRSKEAGSDDGAPDAGEGRFNAQSLAAIGHDLRSPLTGLLGCLSLLEETELDARQQALLTQANGAGESLLNMLEGALLSAQAAHFQRPAQAQRCHLRKRVRQWLAALAPLADSKGLLLTLDFPATLPDLAFGDISALERVVNNLLVNAIKFTDVGAVSLAVRWEPQQQHQGCLLLRVEDNGPGLSAETYQQLSAPFVQGDAAANDGVGLGLAISKCLLSDVGGQMQVAGRKAGGTCVDIRFPLRLEPAVLDGMAARRCWLGIDEPTIREEWRQLLAWLGVEVLDLDTGTALPEVQPSDHVMARIDTTSGALSMSQRAALRQRGVHVIGLASRVDQLSGAGTDFDMVLYYRAPLQQCLAPFAEQVASGAVSSLPAVAAMAGSRLLIVDDDDMAGLALQRSLERHGLAVMRVRTLREATTLMSTTQFQAVLVDFHLPDGSGLEAVADLKAVASHWPPLLIGSSCELASSARCEALLHGLDEYLEKPVSADAVVDIMVSLL
jgi:CheY-like chemotaxis protein/anti-sigma regulatory factor (Ser/Thr protein kinase)